MKLLFAVSSVFFSDMIKITAIVVNEMHVSAKSLMNPIDRGHESSNTLLRNVPGLYPKAIVDTKYTVHIRYQVLLILNFRISAQTASPAIVVRANPSCHPPANTANTNVKNTPRLEFLSSNLSNEINSSNVSADAKM